MIRIKFRVYSRFWQAVAMKLPLWLVPAGRVVSVRKGHRIGTQVEVFRWLNG
jgi:hypothetical protein